MVLSTDNLVLSKLSNKFKKSPTNEQEATTLKSETISESANKMMTASSQAIFTSLLTAPVKRVKILMQCQDEFIAQGKLNQPYTGVLDVMSRIYYSEGIFGFWRGTLSGCMAYIPTQALNVAMKRYIQQVWAVEEADGFKTMLMKHTFGGGIGGVLALTLAYPLSFCSLRMTGDIGHRPESQRMFSSSNGQVYHDSYEVFQKTVDKDGIFGLYSGFTAACVGIFLYRGAYYGLYETLKPKYLTEDSTIQDKIALGMGVTLAAGLIAYPLDTIRCRMVMRSSDSDSYSDMFECASRIYNEGGILSFWNGAGVNIVSGAIGAMALLAFQRAQANLLS